MKNYSLKAYRQGRKAALDGKTLQDCPYGDYTDSRREWMRGYSDGAKQRK